MKQLRKLGLVSVAMSLVALSACGGGGGDDDVDSGLTIVDGGRRDTGTGSDGTVNTPDSSTTAACDPVTNANCTAPMKCSLNQADMFACEPAGAGTQGAACGTGTTDDGCAIGFVCLADNKCHRYCNQTSTCPPNGAQATACNIQIQNASMQPIAGATVCGDFTSCDIFAQTGCGTNMGCYIGSAGATCGAQGSIADGAACGTGGGQCMPGSICVGAAAGQLFCRKVCRTGGTPACTTGTCTAVNFGTQVMNPPPMLGACLP